VDSTTGNIYVAVDAVGGSGASRIVKIASIGAVTDPFVGGLQNPVAVAVDGSGNVYVGDNQLNTISEFGPTGTPVGSAISLPSSTSVPNHIRMAFDSNGNLDVASDSIGGVSGQVEVDQIASNGTLTRLYNTTSMSTVTYSVTAAGTVDGFGNTTYTGTFSPIPAAGLSVTIAGFTGNVFNNGTFIVQPTSTSTQLVVNNSGGVSEGPVAGTATVQLAQIQTVGGISVLADNSIELADYGAQIIYHITNPGATNMAATNMAVTSAISSGLSCNVSGLANPPSVSNTSIYVTENGASCSTPQLQLAVPETLSVTTVNSASTLSGAGAASDGTTTYTGTSLAVVPAGSLITINGFTNAGNNGTYAVVTSTSTQLVVANSNGISENTSATAQTVPLTSPNDVAWYSKH
jgi:hypothetical protein